MDHKLEALRDFEKIEDQPLPNKFHGKLRPYQKAGYNWLQFLSQYKFGGCLADDMGLGKTVQALAMLQAEKERGVSNASLLIMPTSLVYNWEMEAKKFTPGLKVLSYTGTQRNKDITKFSSLQAMALQDWMLISCSNIISIISSLMNPRPLKIPVPILRKQLRN